MAGFVQLIEWKTSKIDEVQKLNDDWRERFPAMGPTRVLVTADRNNEGSYVTVVEFSSYEEAMKNSATRQLRSTPSGWPHCATAPPRSTTSTSSGSRTGSSCTGLG